MKVFYESVIDSIEKAIGLSQRSIAYIELSSEEFDELLVSYRGKLVDLSEYNYFSKPKRKTHYPFQGKKYLIVEGGCI